ncbi:MAG: hypothetical protein P0Y53_06795 [Candidatus Pseudobacter hemicellulosilyticus]|uniref:Uncharacterized protein n=1 Tax=Candidatus Pseudobacter hemicellulosilyticus TaxID=3121375 RepID=A0AAJ6BHG7_9BACT|nr:MAG: hypothetical protein P0Y53_06795 [Pseudobacter sp.]
MIILTTIAEQHVIGFFEDRHADGMLCTFMATELPASLQAQLLDLPGFSDQAHSSYWLNAAEQEKAGKIFKRLIEEEGSGYRYAKQLQLVYLIELLHYILKLHQYSSLPLEVSLN